MARLLSDMAHVPQEGYQEVPVEWTGRRSKLGVSILSFQATVKVNEEMKKERERMQSHFSGGDLCVNVSRADWAEQQRLDEYLGPIYRFLASPSSKDPSAVPKSVRTRSQSYRLLNGILWYRSIREVGQLDLDEGWVIAVPQSLISKVIDTFHGNNASGHGGVRKTTLSIRQRFHFRYLRRRVAGVLQHCKACRRAKLRIAELDAPLSPLVSSGPFQAIALDIYAPGAVTEDGFKYVLTIVDIFTKWTAFFPLKTKRLQRCWLHCATSGSICTVYRPSSYRIEAKNFLE